MNNIVWQLVGRYRAGVCPTGQSCGCPAGTPKFSLSGSCRNGLFIMAVAGTLLLGVPLVNVSAAGSSDSNAPNTIVRFQVIRGTNALGTMDVELFDHDKPQTVCNFLLYLRSGAYSNAFLHRCLPGFIVQGGGFSVTNPLGTASFFPFSEVTNYGRLTNEFLVGPRLSNTFGTLVMAKVGGDPNSATSQWFFNMADNTGNLDNQNGGFTVFGRCTNAVQLTNVLGHFNTLATNAGIVNLGPPLGSNYSVFSDLPVAFTNGSRVPANQELYYAQMSVLNETTQPGQSPPAISLASPPPSSSFTNQTVAIRGTASDDASVARVVYQFRGGPLEIASGTTNWVVNLSPSPGLNTVTVQSVDWDGNFSAPASVTFLYVAKVPLQLQVVGTGTVAGATNRQLLQVGTYYTLTATPGNGSVFDSWSGSASSTSPSLTFQVPTNATNFSLTAKFILDPLPQLAGNYQGLFQGTTTPPAPENAGYMTLNLQASGLCGGTILHRAGTYSFAGQFDSTGAASLQGDVGGITRAFTLRLQKTNAAGLITGTFINNNTTTAGNVQLERIASALPASNAPPAGSYTFAIPLITNVPDQLIPGGDGFGTGTLAGTGFLSLSGTLGDGTSFSAAPPLTRLGHWPLYVSQFAGRGVLLGWLSSATNPPGNLDGSLQWIKSPAALDSTYPAGFSNQVTFQASAYAPPTAGVRVLNWAFGLAGVAGTDLQLAITNLVALTTNNALTVMVPNPASLKLNLDPKTGLVNGSFIHPWFGTSNALRGVVLSRAQTILGQFIAGNQAGSLTIRAVPLPSVTVAPTNGNVRTGTNFTFQATASGPVAVSFFWLKDGVPVAGATNSTLTLTSVTNTDTGNYSVAASNISGVVTSSVATLTVDSRPLLITQPTDLSLPPGGSSNFVVAVDGPALNYAWLHNNSAIFGAANATLPILSAAPPDQGSYQVIVTNFAGAVTSRVATLTFNSLALSITDPQSTNVVEGSPASFMVLASGVDPISYQWYFQNSAITNATNNLLAFASVNRTNQGMYYVTVSNAYRLLTSAPATLGVTIRPILSITRSTTNLVITSQGAPGAVHTLLCATNLSPANTWTAVATNTLSILGTIDWPRPLPTNGAVFYRATVSP